MIARHSFSREWIAKQRERYFRVDPLLIERQIHAFELLGLLATSGKPFVFKGGTALLLLLPVARRLSIDVDVVGAFTPAELGAMAEGSVFIRAEEDERGQTAIPKRHFKYFYVSAIDGREAYVLLDVLHTSHGYPKVQSIPVVNDLFEVDTRVSVTVPTINWITGDKLTAFAPHTIGVPLGAGKSMEIIKQLFDIGELFDHVEDITELSAAYKAIWQQEEAFHERPVSITGSLDDTIDTALLISQARLKGSIQNSELEELLKGVGQIGSYSLGSKWNVDDARLASAKAAFLAATILKGDYPSTRIDDMRYRKAKLDTIKDITLGGRYRVLNKLKGLRPEAFYYWWLVSRL